MAAVHTCDGCGGELPRNFITHRLKGTVRLNRGTLVHLEVRATMNFRPAIVSGDLCRDCLREAMSRLLSEVVI